MYALHIIEFASIEFRLLLLLLFVNILKNPTWSYPKDLRAIGSVVSKGYITSTSIRNKIENHVFSFYLQSKQFTKGLLRTN